MKKRLLRQQRDEALALAGAFREELTRISHLLQMPGSPDLSRDVAPNLETWLAHFERATDCRVMWEKEARKARSECFRLRLALETTHAQLDAQEKSS